MNYFGQTSAAAYYSRFRPYFHPLVVEKIAQVTGPVDTALDVGCGTGQSTIALLAMATNVVGLDPSAAMLDHAPKHESISYRAAHAEALPFENECFDLLTAGLAFHWFDQPVFLREAARVLKPSGWLALYNDGFTGVMVGNPAYDE